MCRASGEGCSEQHAARRRSPKGGMRGEMSVRWLSLTPEDYRRMPWKNGGGVTEEIALDPPGGHWEGPSRILWRVSTALVASSGPFSLFPGYDRFLAVVDGGALELHVEGREPERLHPRGGVCAFSGDARTEGILLEGPCRDFNLFVDRSRGSAALRYVVPGEGCTLRSEGNLGMLFATGGEVLGRGESSEGGAFALAPGDVLLWRREDEAEAVFSLLGPGKALWGEVFLGRKED